MGRVVLKVFVSLFYFFTFFLVIYAHQINAASLQLTWIDNSEDEDGFRIERKLQSDDTYAVITTVGANVTSYGDSGLANSTAYCYRVNAFNSAGNSAYTNEACGTPPATTPPPGPPPSGNTITTNVANGAVLSGSSVLWTAIPSGAPVRVEFFIDSALSWTEGGAPYQFNGNPSGTLNTTTLSNGAHQLTVRATYSDNSTSETTVTVSVANGGTTPTPPPPGGGPTLTVNVVKIQADGTVTSTPTGINCGSTCSATFNSGTRVTLIATASAGSTFAGWSGTGCANGAVTMDASKTCTATFTSGLDQPIAKIGVFRPDTGEWLLDLNGNFQFDGCAVDACLPQFGAPADLPVVGDWDGMGQVRVGVFRPSTGEWFLDMNGNGAWDGCTVDMCVSSFGKSGDRPVTRQISGLNRSIIGTFTPQQGLWQFDLNSNGKFDNCSVDQCAQSFGSPQDIPVVGDWNGSGTEEVGVFTPSSGQWLLDGNGNGRFDSCGTDICLPQFGAPNDLPVVGDWDRTGRARDGVFRPSTGEWFLDMNGNGAWDGCAVDACLGLFGHAGDLPVAGKW